MPRHVFSVDANGEPISFDFSAARNSPTDSTTTGPTRQMCGTGPMIFKEWEEGATGHAGAQSRLLGRAVLFQPHGLSLHSQSQHGAATGAAKRTRSGRHPPRRTSTCKAPTTRTSRPARWCSKKFGYPAYRYVGYNETARFVQGQARPLGDRPRHPGRSDHRQGLSRTGRAADRPLPARQSRATTAAWSRSPSTWTKSRETAGRGRLEDSRRRRRARQEDRRQARSKPSSI